MLSSKHGLEISKVKKLNKTTSKPKIVTFYNKNKKAVNQSDQIASYSLPLCKSISGIVK